jgi:RNA polymerase II subunit A small phosphatase-like protein
VVTREARVVRKPGTVSSSSKRSSATTELREEKPYRKSSRGRRDQVAPESTGDPRMIKQMNRRSKKNLKVETDAKNHLSTTPKTASSTPSNSPPNGVRQNSDLRSPGARKSPTAADAPIPDFMTQTDRYGNASTPRSSDGMAKYPLPQSPTEQTGEDDDEESHVEACAETLLDSLRLVCCCLAPEEPPTKAQPKVLMTEADTRKEGIPRLLPALHPDDHGKKCLVLDLDETLVHSSFRAVPGADFIIPVQVCGGRRVVCSAIRICFLNSHSFSFLCLPLEQIEDVVHFVYVMKRPGVDEFLVEMAKYYEVVIYTASLNKYADPLLDLLDPHQTIRSRLFRESCVYYEGNYVKDLSLIDRNLADSIIVDNSPNSYLFHPANAIDCSSFIDDPRDRELDQIGAFLKGIKDVKDVRGIAPQWREWPSVNLEGQ